MHSARWALAAGLTGLLVTTGLAARPQDPEVALDQTYRAADGRVLALKAPEGGATALVFTSTECPIANYYCATLNELAKSFEDRPARLIGVVVDPGLPASALKTYSDEYRLTFPVIQDPRGALARALGVSVTPEAVVIDAKGAVRYRGRIDDQYAARRVKNAAPETHELRDALAAVLEGKDVAQPRVEAVGCPLPEPPDGAEGAVTYSRDVAAILDQNCRECHRGGQIGPFALETYEQARKRAADIAAVAEGRIMPPWRAAPGSHAVPFRHDRSLSDQEIATLVAWSEGGAPEGDPADRPAPPSFSDDWALGTPDLVIEMPVDFEVPASGGDIYRCFVIPTNLPDDMYVSGLEYRPGNPRVVHHILGYVDVSGEARKKDEAEDGPGYTCFGGPGVEINNDLGGWAPGAGPSQLPDGVGRPFPKGGDVIMQVHYHPNGKPETDRSRVGLYFAKKPVKQAFHWSWVANFDFKLMPDQPGTWEVAAERELPTDLEALAVTPHMHKLGKDMAMWAVLPDGRRIDLITIDQWDFQWQIQYYYEHAILLPKGTKLHLLAHFDYAHDNPNVSDPKDLKPITWGEATTDEMCIGFIGLVKANQDLTRPGEKDDLRSILQAQEDELRERAKKKHGRGRGVDAGE
jgi:peroxiredoxin